MILGEDQILAQVKDALSRAREAQCCGGTLEVLFRHAVTGAKRVKSQLLLSTANASAAELAIDRMWKEGYDFAGSGAWSLATERWASGPPPPSWSGAPR